MSRRSRLISLTVILFVTVTIFAPSGVRGGNPTFLPSPGNRPTGGVDSSTRTTEAPSGTVVKSSEKTPIDSPPARLASNLTTDGKDSSDFSPDNAVNAAPNLSSVKTPESSPSGADPNLSKTPIDPPKNETGTTPRKSGGILAFLGGVAKLLIVLAAIFGLFYFLRRLTPRTGRPLPRGVLEVVGQYPVTMKARFSLVRFGSKLLLVSVSGDQIEKLAEINDPDEIETIVRRCRAEDATNTSTGSESPDRLGRFLKRKGDA